MGRYEQLAGAGAPDRVEQYRKTLRQVINISIIIVIVVHNDHSHFEIITNVKESPQTVLLQALHVWLDQFPEDFIEPPNFPCLSHFESFCRSAGGNGDNIADVGAGVLRHFLGGNLREFYGDEWMDNIGIEDGKTKQIVQKMA